VLRGFKALRIEAMGRSLKEPAVFVDLGIKSMQPGVDALAIQKQWLLAVCRSPKDDLTQPIQL
jgi:hypothetical protein